jgi:hypothetical protein
MKKILKIILPILVSLLIVIVFNNLLKIKSTNLDESKKAQDTLSEAPINGLGFAIKDGESVVDSIDKNKIKNYKLILANNTNERKKFSLTILAGYEQQTFKYENKDTDICNLSIEPKSEIVLPIELNDNKNNNLFNYTFTFIPNPNENVRNVKVTDMSKYKDFTFIVPVIKSNDNLEFKTDNRVRENFLLDGLNVIPYADKKQLENKSFRPNYEVKRKKDENSLIIPLVIGGGDCTDYIVYCLVNGKQALINGKYVLRYNIENKNAILDDIKVNIDQSSESEVVFFIKSNPQSVEQNQDIESSYRFTVVGE